MTTPDSGIKKVTILSEDLPVINFDVGGYAVRYRIVSEDRNRYSHWSPIHYVDAGYVYVPGSIKVSSKTSDAISIIWDKVSVKKDDVEISKIRDYDVWVRWGRGGEGDWLYDGKIQSNTVSLLIPDEYTKDGIIQASAPNELSVEVFLEATPPTRDLFKVYSIDRTTV